MRFDEQEKRLQMFESRIEANSKAVKENKENIGKMQKQLETLTNENRSLKEMCLENARYKRWWDLRLLGLKERENKDTKDMVVGILTRVIPVVVDKLREIVDAVHCLGKKKIMLHITRCRGPSSYSLQRGWPETKSGGNPKRQESAKK